MRLCDAIRKGCEGNNKIIKFISFGNDCCVMGAVLKSCGLAMNYLSYELLAKRFPFLLLQAVSPVKELDIKNVDYFGENSVGSIMIALNNRTDWSRERIADWIEREFESSARLTEPESKDEPVLQEVLKESVSG